MRKHLIGTILVLAALAACNKEVETPAPAVDNGQEEVTPGKVTLTFKATIDEGTRTSYDAELNGSWVAEDAITVCVTNGTDFETAKFTTTDGDTFSGEVSDGYTTIVSGVYPADNRHVFTAGAVTSVYLSDTYSLGTANDGGIALPMVGEMVVPEGSETPTFTFHHICGALKITLTNIPTDATVFTFAANGQQIAGSFTLSDGRMGLDDGTSNTSVQFTFTSNPDQTERSFYIPVPDGILAANSFITVGNADEVLFKKKITSSPTFGQNNGKGAIKVLPPVACWTRNEDWNAYYYGSYKTTAGTIYKRICLENMTGSYQYEVLTGTTFNDTYGGSVANYLSSAHFEEYVRGLTQSYSAETRNLNYSSLSHGTKYVIVFGLDTERKFTGEYNCIEVVYPTFSTPDGWSISVVETDSYPMKYKVPDGTKWQNVTVSATTFTDYFLGDLEFLIYYYARDFKNKYEADPSDHAPRTGNVNIKAPSSNGEYVFVSFGIDDDYRATGEYCRLDYSFETPSDQYNAWLGTWTVTDETNTDTWTISRKQANHSYTITGIAGQEYKVVGEYNDGSLTLSSQLLEEKYGTNQRDLYLLARNSSGGLASNPLLTRLILTATIENGDVTVTPSTETAPGGYGIYYKIANYNPRGVRDFSHTITMTRVPEQ